MCRRLTRHRVHFCSFRGCMAVSSHIDIPFHPQFASLLPDPLPVNPHASGITYQSASSIEGIRRGRGVKDRARKNNDMNNITYNVRGWLVYEVDTDGDTLLHYQGTRTAFDLDLLRVLGLSHLVFHLSRKLMELPSRPDNSKLQTPWDACVVV
ncbi:hypothetical protein KQX54_006922 [Cotesia glomerata]|uniref:Uncharacterized protein n=1 Tax=Cotesia glomerata TaxID=32391 RepID=A0AAV7I313_COTGL|nr:hypothetical protein KQX54_006922 [Cotesia glomerata]